MMRVRDTFHADFQGKSLLIWAGEEYPDDHPLVKAFRPLFEPVEEEQPKRRGRRDG